MLTLTLSFLAGIVATAMAIRLYPILKNSQLAELIIIAVRNRWIPAPAPQQASQEMQAEKERAMAAGLRTN